MTLYATLEEAIDAARETFLADNPGLEEGDADVQQFNMQSTLNKTATLCGRPSSLPTKMKTVNAYRCSLAKRPRAYLTATSMKLNCVRNG